MTSSQSGTTDEKLFIGLAADLITQAWVGMGKIKNPITDKLEPNLPAAALLIDMLDMLKRKTEGRRGEEEDKLLTENLQQLKLNYIHELDQQKEAEAEQSDEGATAADPAAGGDTAEAPAADDPAGADTGAAPSGDADAASESG